MRHWQRNWFIYEDVEEKASLCIVKLRKRLMTGQLCRPVSYISGVYSMLTRMQLIIIEQIEGGGGVCENVISAPEQVGKSILEHENRSKRFF